MPCSASRARMGWSRRRTVPGFAAVKVTVADTLSDLVAPLIQLASISRPMPAGEPPGVPGTGTSGRLRPGGRMPRLVVVRVSATICRLSRSIGPRSRQPRLVTTLFCCVANSSRCSPV